MTRHMNNPFKRLEGARHYSISTELFFCLIKLYRDFSNKRAGFELTKYYELYLQSSENKKVSSALLTPKSKFSDDLESYHFDYDIVNQKQIIDAHDDIWHLPVSEYTWNDDDNIQDLIVPASVLNFVYLTYQTFLHENKTGLSLRWQGYSLAFLGDEPLMALAVYPAMEPGKWMEGVLGGLEGNVIYDLQRDFIVKSEVRIWGMPEEKIQIQVDEDAIERKRQNKRLNKQLRKQNRSL